MTHSTPLPQLSDADQLYSLGDVHAAIRSVAEQINRDLSTLDPVVYCVLSGGIVFAGQLLPMLDFPLELSYLHATRYRGATEGSHVRWIATPDVSPMDRNILILDDILDEGHTLEAILKECKDLGAASVRTAVLVDKQHERKAYPGMRCDYTGLTVPDRYVFGCGMDYREYWRNAPGIYALRESD